LSRVVDPSFNVCSGGRAELRISKACRRKCVFCCEARGMLSGARFMPLKEAVAIMDRLRTKGVGHITFIGGEPTIHPDFHRIARAARLLGYTVQVTTDGTGLADASRAAGVLADIDELCLSVHWHNEALAREVTRFDSAFSDTEAAFENIKRFGRLRLFMCHSVICSLNLAAVPDICEYVFSKARPGVLMLSQLIPWGRGRSSYDSLTVSMTDIVRVFPPVKRLLDVNGARLLISGIPLCVLGGWGRFSNDLGFSPRVVLERGKVGAEEEVLSFKKSLVPPLNRIKTRECASCALFEVCAGVFPDYLKKYGVSELQPVSARSAGRLLRETTYVRENSCPG